MITRTVVRSLWGGAFVCVWGGALPPRSLTLWPSQGQCQGRLLREQLPGKHHPHPVISRILLSIQLHFHFNFISRGRGLCRR